MKYWEGQAFAITKMAKLFSNINFDLNKILV
jgi:hypothetical protein